MAEKESKREAKIHESRGMKKKLKLHSIHTTKADDGSFVHEHHYKDEHGMSHPSRFGGTSADMDDLKQHMEDHFGEEPEEQEETQQEEPEGSTQQPSEAPVQGQ